jgi:hypothetical protein
MTCRPTSGVVPGVGCAAAGPAATSRPEVAVTVEALPL